MTAGSAANPKQRGRENRDAGSGFMNSAVPLMQEYTKRLQDLVADADDVRQALVKLSSRDNRLDPQLAELEFQYLNSRTELIKERFQHLRPPVEDLDRHVSQMIEHGHLEANIDRVELKLRLTDLELALFAAERLLNLPMPLVPRR